MAPTSIRKQQLTRQILKASPASGFASHLREAPPRLDLSALNRQLDAYEAPLTPRESCAVWNVQRTLAAPSMWGEDGPSPDGVRALLPPSVRDRSGEAPRLTGRETDWTIALADSTYGGRLRLSPDARSLYYVDKSSHLRVYARDTGEKQWELKLSEARFEAVTPTVSADGKTLIAAGGDYDQSRLWVVDLEKQQARCEIDLGPGPLNSPPVLTPDGKTLIIATEEKKELRGFDPVTGEQKWSFELPNLHNCRHPPVLSPDGATVYFSYTERFTRKGGTYAVDVATGEQRWKNVEWSCEHGRPPLLSADGKTLYVADDGKVTAFDAESGEQRWRTPVSLGWLGANAMALSRDGLALAAPGDGNTHVIDATDGELQRSIPTARSGDSAITPAFTADGTTLITMDSFGVCRRTDLTDPQSEPETLGDRLGSANSFTLGPEERWIYIDGYGKDGNRSASAIELTK
jgi:outer membrane protein assembly factor BamB